MNTSLLRLSAVLSLLLGGAIFGFFYAWVCSTMWGLDTADPRVAIAAMQAMNASVRNAVFAPVFFATPAVMGLTALLAWTSGLRSAALAFAAAALVYLFGGLLLTVTVNVPMNRALGAIEVPTDIAEARAVWDAYSPRWQLWNAVRTVFSGAALLATGLGIHRLGAGGKAAA